MKLAMKSIIDQVHAEITHAYEQGGTLALRKIEGVDLTPDEWHQLMHERRYLFANTPATGIAPNVLKFRYCPPMRGFYDPTGSDYAANLPAVFDFTIRLGYNGRC